MDKTDEEALAAKLEGYDQPEDETIETEDLADEPESADEPEVEETVQPQATDWEAIAREKGWGPQQQQEPVPQPQTAPDYTSDYQEIADLMYTDPAAALAKQAELTRKQVYQDLGPILAPMVQQTAVQTVQRLTNAEPELAPYIEQVAREAGIAGNVTKEQAEFIADAARGRAIRTGGIKPQTKTKVVATTAAEPVRASVTQSIPAAIRPEVAEFEKAFGVKVDGAYMKKHGIQL
jgi:hypothetical protein